MAPIIDNARRPGCYIADEVSVNMSRAIATIAAGSGVLVAGTVLGKIGATAEYAPLDLAAADGSETAAAILYAGVDATLEAETGAVISKTMTAVNASEITWPEGITEEQQAAAIASLEERQITVLPADGVTLPPPATTGDNG